MYTTPVSTNTIDGICMTTTKIITLEDYRALKKDIAESFNLTDQTGKTLSLTALNLIHEE